MEEIKLPPPERAAKTAIGAGSGRKGTVGSYLKADALFSEKGGRKLDYGSGRGEGAKLIKADTYEPYVKSKPKYDDAKKIPNASYNKVTSLNVLNVLPPEARNEAVKNIGRILTVNGEAIVSTRGVKDVESAKNKVKARDGYIIGKGDDARFQKGFTTQELKDYVQKTLGKGFTVETVKGVGKAAIKIKKLNIPRGLGGVLRQEGTPVLNIQEQLLINPRKKFSQGGDTKMDNEFKRLRFEELEKFYEQTGSYHEQDPRNRMNFFNTDPPEERQNRIQNKIKEIKREDALESTGGRLEALPMSRKEGLERKKEIEDEDVKKGAKARAAKGGSMSKQMELFNEGGLKDEGGTVDPVSGNDVPPGSTQEEVRDDIPAQLSEGEFVFPADVVRYIGLEKLMMLRQEAKQGLKQMEAMGQMGNSDEATMPDDLPFDETDLEIEDDLEYNTGGVVQAQQGAYMQPTIPTANTNTGMAQPQTGFAPVQYTTSPFTGNPQNVYNPQGTQYAPASYQDLLGASAGGAPQTKNVRYFNKATNQVRMIPHLLNPDGSIGDTLYPIPDGFVREDEAPKEEAKKTKVESTKVKPAEAGDSGPSDDASKGGATLSFGGNPNPNKPGLQQNAITANISYNVSALGGIIGLAGGMSKIADINKGKDVETIGNQYGKPTKPVEMSLGRGKPVSVTSKTYASIKNSVYGQTAKDMKNRLEVLDSIASKDYTFNSTTNQYTDKFGNTLSLDDASQAGKDINDYIDQEISKGKSLESILDNLSDTEKSIAQDDAIEQEDDSDTDDSQNTGGFDFGDKTADDNTTSTGIGTDIDDDDDSYQDNDSNGGYSDSDSDTGGTEDTGGGSMCVIATHGISTGGFTPMEKAKAELWCQRTYHGKWYGEAFRRGYRAWGIKHINNGTAPQVYQEFKDFVSCGRGIKKGFKLKLHYYLRTLHLFITGLFIKR